MLSSSLLVLLLNTLLAASGWLGVFVESETPRPGEEGVLIVRIIEDGPAEAAGLRKGDRIVRVGDVRMLRFEDLGKALHDIGAGQEVKLRVIREGKEIPVPLVLGERPPQLKVEEQEKRWIEEQKKQEERRKKKEWVIAAPDAPLAPPSRVERIRRGYLGVDVLSLTEGLKGYFEMKDGGVLVSRVVPGSPAEKGGLQAGDVITVVNGQAIAAPVDLQKAIRELAKGETAEIALVRDGKRMVRSVAVGEREAEAFFFSAPSLTRPQLLLEMEKGEQAYAEAMKRYEEAIRLRREGSIDQQEFQQALQRHASEYQALAEEREVLQKMQQELATKLKELERKLAEVEKELREASTPQD